MFDGRGNVRLNDRMARSCERFTRLLNSVKRGKLLLPGALSAALLLTVLLTSCAVPFIPQVPPASYSLDAAINVLSNKYYLMDSGEVDGFAGVGLGEGRYATFGDVDGIFMVFKYDSPAEARERWDAVTKKYNNPLKLKYLRLNMGSYGLFTVRLNGSDLIAWYRDVWLIIVNGDNIDKFVRDVNDIYKLSRAD